MKAALRNVIRQRLLVNDQSRAIALSEPVEFFYFFGLLFACAGLAATSSLIHLLPIAHPSIKPAIALANPQPENVGSIMLTSIEDTPATVIMAGDSLARGKGSRVTNGILENIGYYLTQKANTIEPGLARYHVIPGLTVDGSPVEDMNRRITAQSETLAAIPNLVFVMSFTNGDLVRFVADAKTAQSSNRIIAFFKVLGILHTDSKEYQQSLAVLQHTLTDLYAKRVKLLGSKKAAMQVVILGLPNEAYSPPIKAILHTYGLTYNEFSYVINTYNADDHQAAIHGNNDNAEVTYSFVNLDRLQVSQKKALSYLSADQFHPNYRGYQSLANFVGQRVAVQGKSQSVFLVNR